MSSKPNRSGMPKPVDIYDYWESRIDGLCEDRYNFGPLEHHHCCFACGSYHRIERAHIVPLCDGGTNDASNLHLLCARCHIDSETLVGDLYWEWLGRMRETSVAIHEIKRYERLYGPDWVSYLSQTIDPTVIAGWTYAIHVRRRSLSQREREAIREEGNV